MIIALVAGGRPAHRLLAAEQHLSAAASFPRIVVIAHAGTRPPIDDAHRHAADRAGDHGSAGHPPRPLEHLPRRRGDLGPVRSRAPTWSWRCSRCRTASPRSAAELPHGPDLVVERLTPAVFPFFILNLTGRSVRRPLDYALLRDSAGAGAGPGRRPGRGAGQRHARDRGHPRSGKLIAADLTVDDVAAALKASTCSAGRPLPGDGLQHLVLASGLWTSLDEIARTPVVARAGATVRVRDLGTRRHRLAGSHAAHHRQRPRCGRDQRLAAGRRQHPRPCGKASRTRSPRLTSLAAGRPADHQDLRPRGVRRRARSPTCATPS